MGSSMVRRWLLLPTKLTQIDRLSVAYVIPVNGKNSYWFTSRNPFPLFEFFDAGIRPRRKLVLRYRSISRRFIGLNVSIVYRLSIGYYINLRRQH